MVMSWIFSGLIMLSLMAAALLGKGSDLSRAIPLGAKAGVELGLQLAGSLCLWAGVGRLMERAGITASLAKLLGPFTGKLFPGTKKDPELAECLTGNLCANLLGLGNAATPMGIRAAQKMADPARPGVATDQMCRLIVLNTASIQLLPTNVAAIRATAGSGAPFDILGAVWLTSLCSAGVGLMAAWLFGKLCR